MKLKRIFIFFLAVALLLPTLCLSEPVHAAAILGDMDSNGTVTDADAVYLLRHTLFPQQYR